jgi:hypothetical protein
VAILATRDLAEHKAKAFQIVKQRCHELRRHVKNPKRARGTLGAQDSTVELGDVVGCLTDSEQPLWKQV